MIEFRRQEYYSTSPEKVPTKNRVVLENMKPCGSAMSTPKRFRMNQLSRKVTSEYLHGFNLLLSDRLLRPIVLLLVFSKPSWHVFVIECVPVVSII